MKSERQKNSCSVNESRVITSEQILVTLRARWIKECRPRDNARVFHLSRIVGVQICEPPRIAKINFRSRIKRPRWQPSFNSRLIQRRELSNADARERSKSGFDCTPYLCQSSDLLKFLENFIPPTRVFECHRKICAAVWFYLVIWFCTIQTQF